MREAGAAAFTDGSRSIRNSQTLRRAMTYARDFDALIVHFPEDRDLAGSGVMNAGELATRLGLSGVPREAEAIALDRDIRLVRMTGARYCAAPISTTLALDVIAKAKAEGLPVSCGVTINHLTLNENDIGSYRTFLKLKPPLRREEERLALVEAVASGLIDMIFSDHNPQDVETKRLPFGEADFGAVGLETLLSAGLRLVHAGQVPLANLLRAMTTRPADILRLEQGRLQARRARRPDPLRPRRALRAEQGRSQVALQEHALRRGAAAGRGQDDHGRRRDRPWRGRERWSAHDGPSLLAPRARGAGRRLWLRLDPLRPAADQGGGARRRALDRLRQYRRDQRAAHRPQGHRRRALCCSTRSRGRRRCCCLRPSRRKPGRWRVSAPFSAIFSRSGSKFKGGKGVATFLGCLFGFAWPAGLAFIAIWLSVAFLSRYSSLSALVASAASPVVLWLLGLPAQALLLARHGRDPVVEAQREHRPPARRDRRPDRPEDMKAARLTDEQKLDWLQLIRCENIGPRTFRALMQRHGDAAAALRALPDLIRQGKGRAVVMALARTPSCANGSRPQRLGARFVALCEPDYPPGLRAIDAPAAADRRSRRRRAAAEADGRAGRLAQRLRRRARHDRKAGARAWRGAAIVVVSGLARGIDACAHRASLATGAVGVLAGGLDRPYPPENLALLDQMAERGAVIAEMPFGYEPRGRDFPRRNRIVSGLSLATVVVEAARRSGSLITARFAQEQGREVFAVPGSPLDPRAEGTNDLIRDGALLCASAQDVIDVVAPLAARGATRYDLLFEPEPAPYDEPLWEECDWELAPADSGRDRRRHRSMRPPR